jgi:hypothetical protein
MCRSRCAVVEPAPQHELELAVVPLAGEGDERQRRRARVLARQAPESRQHENAVLQIRIRSLREPAGKPPSGGATVAFSLKEGAVSRVFGLLIGLRRLPLPDWLLVSAVDRGCHP